MKSVRIGHWTESTTNQTSMQTAWCSSYCTIWMFLYVHANIYLLLPTIIAHKYVIGFLSLGIMPNSTPRPHHNRSDYELQSINHGFHLFIYLFIFIKHYYCFIHITEDFNFLVSLRKALPALARTHTNKYTHICINLICNSSILYCIKYYHKFCYLM